MCRQENENLKKPKANTSLSKRQSSVLIKKLEERVAKLQKLVDIQEMQKDSLKRRNTELTEKIRELLSK